MGKMYQIHIAATQSTMINRSQVSLYFPLKIVHVLFQSLSYALESEFTI